MKSEAWTQAVDRATKSNEITTAAEIFCASRLHIASSADGSTRSLENPISYKRVPALNLLLHRSILIFVCLFAQIGFGQADPRMHRQPARIRNARVFVIYSTHQGHTEKMAEAVALGARSVGQVEVMLKEVDSFPLSNIAEADAIILGGPVHNANIDPQLQQFINKWPFKDKSLRNKIGAAFVTAGGFSAGEELAQLAILHSMLAFGMIVVGGDTWQSAFGASAILDEAPSASPQKRGEIMEYYLKKAEALGRRVAQLAARQAACL